MSEQPGLLEQAIAVLDTNHRGGFTAPAPMLYPHQWLWDSCFIAIGLRHIDMDRAQTEILSLLQGQWHNGMLPHMIFQDGVSYEAERRGWHSVMNAQSADTVATSGITQPPMLAEAIVRIGTKLTPVERRSWYKRTYPALLRYHAWLYKERDPDQTGLVSLVHPWETGLDNTPSWMHLMHDQQMPVWLRTVKAVGLDNPAGMLRRDTRHVPIAERYSTIDALAMFAAQRRLRRLRYDSTAMLKRGPFNVQDIAFNAILIRANDHLLKIAAGIDQTVPAGLRASFKQARQAIEELWDPYTSHYYPRDMRSKRPLKYPTIASLLMLYAGCLSKERATSLVATLLEDDKAFGPAYPIPSVPLSAADFDPSRYWQGPAWFNTNWLIMDGLRRHGFIDHADAIGDIMLETVRAHGFREYYHPLTGAGLGASNFSWTAALIIDLLHD